MTLDAPAPGVYSPHTTTRFTDRNMDAPRAWQAFDPTRRGCAGMTPPAFDVRARLDAARNAMLRDAGEVARAEYIRLIALYYTL